MISEPNNTLDFSFGISCVFVTNTWYLTHRNLQPRSVGWSVPSPVIHSVNHDWRRGSGESDAI